MSSNADYMGNETREITDITFLPPQRVSFVLRLRQSFPEDCVRLKLSSTRASQAGLKEMMTRRRVGAVVTSNPGERETACTACTNPDLYVEGNYRLFQLIGIYAVRK